MKIVIITQNAPIYLADFLDNFCKLLKQTPHELIRVVTLSPFVLPPLQEIQFRFRYYGIFDFSKMVGLILKNKIASKIPAQLRKKRCFSLINVAKKHGLTMSSGSNINSQEFSQKLKEDGVELVISIAAPKKFQSLLLSTPRLGCINYHTALLPKYRGRQPLFWALFEGEKTTGITIHKMNTDYDGGEIIAQEAIPIDPQDSLHSLYLKTIKIGPSVLIQAIERIQKGEIAKISNSKNEGFYRSIPTAKEVEIFRREGKRFF